MEKGFWPVWRRALGLCGFRPVWRRALGVWRRALGLYGEGL